MLNAFNLRRGKIKGVKEGHPPGDRDRTLQEKCQGEPCKLNLLE